MCIRDRPYITKAILHPTTKDPIVEVKPNAVRQVDVYNRQVFSFLPCEEAEVHVLKKDVLELYPVVFQLILAEVPLKVVKSGISYPKGEGDVYKRQSPHRWN